MVDVVKIRFDGISNVGERAVRTDAGFRTPSVFERPMNRAEQIRETEFGRMRCHEGIQLWRDAHWL